MIQAVIFDQDGVIFDNEPFISKSYEMLVRSYGKTPVFKKHGLMQNVGMRGSINWEELKKTYTISEDTQVLREKRREVHLGLLQGKLTPMAGLLPLLNLLKEEKVKIALATGSSPTIVDRVLEGLGVKQYFNVVVTGWDYTESKPHPQPFLLTSERLHISPADCLVIEDSLPGVMAAKAAGMKVIAVPTKYSEGDDFSQADLVVKSLEEINWETIQKL